MYIGFGFVTTSSSILVVEEAAQPAQRRIREAKQSNRNERFFEEQQLPGVQHLAAIVIIIKADNVIPGFLEVSNIPAGQFAMFADDSRLQCSIYCNPVWNRVVVSPDDSSRWLTSA